MFVGSMFSLVNFLRIQRKSKKLMSSTTIETFSIVVAEKNQARVARNQRKNAFSVGQLCSNDDDDDGKRRCIYGIHTSVTIMEIVFDCFDLSL